jgi:AraC family transcriptional regulator of adaptative response/methylated-DNA-[protein]-cysteine methyltransferase
MSAAPVISYTLGSTPLGQIIIAATAQGICFIEFFDSMQNAAAVLQRAFPKAVILPLAPIQQAQFDHWLTDLNAFLNGHCPTLDLPLDPHGTPFQLATWQHLRSLPIGTTTTYAQVAAAIGKPRAVRAVASACARNQIALAIPCHRVIRRNGGLAGFRWGLERKQRLLALEQYLCQQGSSQNLSTAIGLTAATLGK